MKNKKGWEYQEVTPQSYYNSFVNGYNDFGYEVLYYDGNRLIGVDLIDILEDGISSIYFYYDPEYTKYSLGKFSLFNQIKFAKQSRKKWIYLGYYVENCSSLSYKAHYKPYLTLDGRPNLHENFNWFTK
jgi:arginine-tRNA-protein transferase